MVYKNDCVSFVIFEHSIHSAIVTQIRKPFVSYKCNSFFKNTMIADLSTQQTSQGSLATAGVDYTPVSDVRIVIPPGMASVNWIIDLNGGTEVESIESFEVHLSNTVGCNIQGISSTRVDI